MTLIASPSGARHPLVDEVSLRGPDGAVAGAQDRVVLVPCSGSSARQWQALSAALDGFAPLALELTGHGDRPGWHGAGALSLAREAAAIAEACPDGAPFHLVGHSYGGAVALRFAKDFPHRLRSLTLVEPSCFSLLGAVEDGPALLAEIRGVAERVNRGVLDGDYVGGIRPFIDYWSGDGAFDALADARRQRFAALAQHVAHHFAALLGEGTPVEAYASLAVPTLILAGTRSPGPSRAIARLLAETLPRARHRTIAGAGHMAPITHPAEVNAPILEHLRFYRSPRPQPVPAHCF